MYRFLLSIVVGWLCATSAVAVDAVKLNILFIAVDDLGSVHRSTAQPQAITPNLDRLAASGMRFDHAYCQIPLCNPSRASVLAGVRPDTCGVFDLKRHFRESMPNVVTLPQHFKDHGWYSARVGKIFHYDVPKAIGTDGLDDQASWHTAINPKGRDVADEADIINPTPEKPISAALSWLAAEGSDEEQTDGMIASETIRLMEQHCDKPFFIAAGFFRPHTPFVAPKKYFDLYPLEQLALPKSPLADRSDIPRAAFAHNNQEPHYGLPEDACREALRGYLASVSFVDAQIGRLLDALDRLGLASSTTVVLWSDHGYHLGEHAGIWQKRTLFEESARSPLILRWPASAAKGLVCNRIVELVDIYPTLSDLAGLPAPKHLAGRSLRPLLNHPLLEWSHSACTQILRPGNGTPIMGRSIRTQRWRYTQWDEGRSGNELYDHDSDPREFVNLANQPDNESLIEELRIQLQRNASGMVPRTPFDPSRL